VDMINNMKERPIIMSVEMVEAILTGTKTQTRRICNPQPTSSHTAQGYYPGGSVTTLALKDGKFTVACKFGIVGDRLYVRECWRVHRDYDRLSPRLVVTAMGGDTAHCIDYRSTPSIRDFWGKWRPAIFLPKSFARITLEILKVRVERVQDISEEDAKAEGCNKADESEEFLTAEDYRVGYTTPQYYSCGYKLLWDSLHGRGAWDKNPWVWVIEFKAQQSVTAEIGRANSPTSSP
jgi:hypothetical protein